MTDHRKNPPIGSIYYFQNNKYQLVTIFEINKTTWAGFYVNGNENDLHVAKLPIPKEWQQELILNISENKLKIEMMKATKIFFHNHPHMNLYNLQAYFITVGEEIAKETIRLLREGEKS